MGSNIRISEALGPIRMKLGGYVDVDHLIRIVVRVRPMVSGSDYNYLYRPSITNRQFYISPVSTPPSRREARGAGLTAST